MAKYNKAAVLERPATTVNLAGGEAFAQDAIQEFIGIVLTSFVKDQYYRSEDETVKRIKELMTQIDDKLFLAKAAVYARNEFGMRSISHLVAAELAHTVKGEEWTRAFFEKIVRRPDDMTEIISYYIDMVGNDTIPNAVKDGFAAKLQTLDAYQLAKYRANGKKVSMLDVVRFCHPRYTEALNALINGTLAPAETWETKLTEAGQKAESKEDKLTLKADAWRSLIGSRKLGYFALLKNLRNILAQAPEMVPAACEMLQDEKLIRKSLVLPFRYMTAYDELTGVSGSQAIITALCAAADIATVHNMPKFEGRTLVVLDVSGSMMGKPAQIGAIMSAALNKSNDCDMMTFDTTAKYKNVPQNIDVLTAAKQMAFAGGGTDLKCIFNTIDKPYARIIILSDMQGWVGYTSPESVFQKYKKQYDCQPAIYSFDLQGYGTSQFDTSKKVYQIAGFSEKIFEVMGRMEQDKSALITAIQAVEF